MLLLNTRVPQLLTGDSEYIKRLIKELIHHRFIFSEGEARHSKMKLIMKWCSKCVSTVITRTARRILAFKAGSMSETAFEAQSAFDARSTSRWMIWDVALACTCS